MYMKLEKLLEEVKEKDAEQLHVFVPKGTKDLIAKMKGRQQATRFTREALYEKFQKEKK